MAHLKRRNLHYKCPQNIKLQDYSSWVDFADEDWVGHSRLLQERSWLKRPMRDQQVRLHFLQAKVRAGQVEAEAYFSCLSPLAFFFDEGSTGVFKVQDCFSDVTSLV